MAPSQWVSLGITARQVPGSCSRAYVIDFHTSLPQHTSTRSLGGSLAAREANRAAAVKSMVKIARAFPSGIPPLHLASTKKTEISFASARSFCTEHLTKAIEHGSDQSMDITQGIAGVYSIQSHGVLPIRQTKFSVFESRSWRFLRGKKPGTEKNYGQSRSPIAPHLQADHMLSWPII